jgi:hypothetical protein
VLIIERILAVISCMIIGDPLVASPPVALYLFFRIVNGKRSPPRISGTGLLYYPSVMEMNYSA